MIPGLLRIELFRSEDERGAFVEAFNVDDWQFTEQDGSPIAFVEDDYSVNRRNVVRGLHGDARTWKLVSCVHGACFAVVVECRPGLKHLVWESFALDGRAPHQLLIPSGCATGFASLQEGTVFTYKQSARYEGPEGQFSLRWNDPALGIDWPVDNPLLSERDATAALLGT